jgi:hypothetical protein
MRIRSTRTNRFRPEVLALEGRDLPAPPAVVIPSVFLVGANVRDLHGAQNACPGLDNAASHNDNPVLDIQMIRHDCSCLDQPPPPPPTVPPPV